MLGPGPVRDLGRHRHPQRVDSPAEDLDRRGHLQQAVVVEAAHRRTPQELPEFRREIVHKRDRPRRAGRAGRGIRCEGFGEVVHKTEFIRNQTQRRDYIRLWRSRIRKYIQPNPTCSALPESRAPEMSES